MMGDARKSVYSSLLFLLFSVYISIESYRLGLGTLRMPGPGIFPFIAGVALGVVSLSLLFGTLLTEPLKKMVAEYGEDSEPINWQNIFLTLAAMYLPDNDLSGLGGWRSTLACIPCNCPIHYHSLLPAF